MRSFKTLTALAAASALALSIGTANAAVMIVAPGGGNALVEQSGAVIDDTGIEFVREMITEIGDLDADDNMATAIVGEGVTRIGIDFNVDQALPGGRRARGIENFTINVMGDMGTMFTIPGITDADGNLLTGGPLFFDVMANETLTFVFDGTAFRRGELLPGYSVGAFAADAVPVPAAGLLFATAAIGGGIARRKRKAA